MMKINKQGGVRSTFLNLCPSAISRSSRVRKKTTKLCVLHVVLEYMCQGDLTKSKRLSDNWCVTREELLN